MHLIRDFSILLLSLLAFSVCAIIYLNKEEPKEVQGFVQDKIYTEEKCYSEMVAISGDPLITVPIENCSPEKWEMVVHGQSFEISKNDYDKLSVGQVVYFSYHNIRGTKFLNKEEFNK